MPASATAAAASSEVAATISHCARSTSKPTARARMSPMRSASSAGAENIASTSPAATYGAASNRSCQPRPAIEPASHPRIDCAASIEFARAIANTTTAENKAEIEMPARISRCESMPLPRRASAATNTAVPSPAMNPSAGNSGAATPARIESEIAAAAPALTPVRYGSTSGLRSIPCNSAPPIASDAPTVAAMATRGSRNCQTIVATSPCACGCSNAENTAAGAMTLPPTKRLHAHAHAARSARPSIRRGDTTQCGLAAPEDSACRHRNSRSSLARHGSR